MFPLESQPFWKRFVRPGIAIGAALWLLAVGSGMKLLLDYQERPGRAARAPAQWPAESRVTRGTNEPTLLALIHPRCPCTRASIGELARVLTRVQEKEIEVVVILVVPPGVDHAWANTDLARTAAALPGVRVVFDDGGLEAKRFGAATSGQALLYDAAGRLQFAGGITPGRGHMGDNAGADAIVALVDGAGPRASDTAVFGCGLDASQPAASALPWCTR